jgi:hypothetical protein
MGERPSIERLRAHRTASRSYAVARQHSEAAALKCAHNNLGSSSIISTTGFDEATIVCLTYHAQFSAPNILSGLFEDFGL